MMRKAVKISAALLEDWMRDHYHGAAIDIGSSGVLDYGLAEVRALAGIEACDLDQVVFRDSPCLGRDDLREAIAARWGASEASQVITTHGSSEAIYAAMMTLLEPGDHVVTMQPAYHSHLSIAESIGCETARWRLRPEDDFQPDLYQLAAVVTGRTKLIVVNFPHNPTGVTLTLAGLDRLLEIADSVGAYVIWDAALADLVYDGDPLPCPGRSYARSVSIGTFSKAFGLPGMRFGWCIAEPRLIAAMTDLRDRMTLSLSPLLEFIALRVVQNAESFVGPRLQTAAASRRLLLEWARRNADVVGMPVPQGGVTAFPLLRGHADTTAICARLSAEYQVLLVPGSAFEHPDRVRLGFGGDPDQFKRGLEILAGELTGRWLGQRK
jgi:capreomycidine synthase